MSTTPFIALDAPAEQRLYVIGDVHGRLDLLLELFSVIDADAGAADATFVLLGDYVDRGPSAAGVLQALVERRRGGCRVVTLLGNHEQMLLAFLNAPDAGAGWMDLGGGATLASYGVQAPKMRSDAPAWAQASAELRAAIPADHMAMLESCQLGLTWEDYIFVHAGVRPGVPLAEQHPDDLTNIRRAFLETPNPVPGATVVHGHSPVREVQLKAGKIGLDTGAYATNVLAALCLVEGQAYSMDNRGSHSPISAEI